MLLTLLQSQGAAPPPPPPVPVEDRAVPTTSWALREAHDYQARQARIRAQRLALESIEAAPAPEARPATVVPKRSPELEQGRGGAEEAAALLRRARAPIEQQPEPQSRPRQDVAAGRALTPAEISELRVLIARSAEEDDIAILLLALAAEGPV